VRQWIDRAENDLLNVSNNLQAQRVPWDTVCFHCQQAAEKYLKAVLTVQGQEVPWTHDLEQLLDLTRQWLTELEGSREDLRWLSVHAVASRYPVEIMEQLPGEQEGVRAQKIAEHIRERCRAYIQKIYPDLLRQA